MNDAIRVLENTPAHCIIYNPPMMIGLYYGIIINSLFVVFALLIAFVPAVKAAVNSYAAIVIVWLGLGLFVPVLLIGRTDKATFDRASDTVVIQQKFCFITRKAETIPLEQVQGATVGGRYSWLLLNLRGGGQISLSSDTSVGGRDDAADAINSWLAAYRNRTALVDTLPPGLTSVTEERDPQTLDNYSDQLQSESERSMGSAVTGSGASRNQSLMAGNTLTVEGTLDAKGTYGLVRVVHHWTPQGYSNSFVCTPWKNYRNPNPPAARTWNGVVSARVTAHNDPKKMGRIQVQFFWQEDGSTHWARATSPHAGPDRGFMFMPEVGDEVAVAFEDGDPERPVIIGALWNGVQTQPRSEFRGGDIANNDVKRIITKSGNRLQMSDKNGFETITLATPNNNVIKLTEQANNTGRTNITIESKTGDIVLHAPNGRVHIESKFYSKDIG